MLSDIVRRLLACASRAGPCALVLCACENTPPGFVPDQVSCRDCEIVVEDVAVIGDSSGDASLTGRPWGTWQDGAGRYWINVLDAIPMVHDPATGQLRDVGRRGSGPGEYRYPTIRGDLPADSMLVSDMHVFRVVTPDLAIAREVQGVEDLVRTAVIRWPDRVLGITAPYDFATGAGRTIIAAYDFSGDRARATDTILTTPPSSGGGAEWANGFRILGRPAADGSVWISDYNHYRLVRYSAAGEPVDSVRRQPDWFPGGEPMRIGGPDQPTTPHLIGNWVDAEGRLWVLASQPRSDTREAWNDVASPTGAVEVSVASLPADYKLNRTIIEVIDVDDRRVIARHTFDGYINSILPDQRVASFTESSLGVPVLRIHRLTLRGDD